MFHALVTNSWRLGCLYTCIVYCGCVVQSFQVGRKTTVDRHNFFVPLNDLIPLEEHLCVCVCVVNKSLNFSLSGIKSSSGTKTYDSLTSSSSTTPSKSRLHLVRGCGSVFLKETVRSNGTPFFAFCETWKGIIGAKLKYMNPYWYNRQ